MGHGAPAPFNHGHRWRKSCRPTGSSNHAGTGPHAVFCGGADTPLSLLPSIEHANPAQGLFAIGYQGSVQAFPRLDFHEQALQAGRGAGQQARATLAFGTGPTAPTPWQRSLFSARCTNGHRQQNQATGVREVTITGPMG